MGRRTGKFTLLDLPERGPGEVLPVYDMEVVEVQIHLFVCKLGACGRSVVTAIRSRFTPERTSLIHLMGEGFRTQSWLGCFGKEKNSVARAVSESDSSLVWPVPEVDRRCIIPVCPHRDRILTGIMLFSPPKCPIRH